MNKTGKRLLCAALALVLPLVPLTPVFAADTDEIHIQTAEDLIELSRNCSLDTWSDGLSVILDNDLSLSDVDYDPIPIFNGRFDGGGHTIYDLSLDAAQSPCGFFLEAGRDALIRDLNITGTVAPTGDDSAVGGIVGRNGGTVMNCGFTGTVAAKSEVGGIVGKNEASGLVSGCHSAGSVMGLNSTGGIVGSNDGAVAACGNSAFVNTESVDPSIRLDSFDTSSILNFLRSLRSDNAGITSDTGGVCGTSSGFVERCTNGGTVGYLHLGYNVGGVVGHSQGYLADCDNSAAVYGRRAVGGVVGLAEPYIVTEQTQNLLAGLGYRFAALSSSIDKAIEDAGGYSDILVGQLSSLGSYLAPAAGAVHALDPADPASIEAFRSAVGESVGAMAAVLKNIAENTDGESEQLVEDFQDINDNLNALSGTAIQAMSLLSGAEEADVLSDDSGKDSPAELTLGKTTGCSNSGEISGDSNTGGIAGAVALDKELEAEENTASGNSLVKNRYSLRVVILNCVNRGAVTAKNDCAGGICGRMDFGCLENCAGYGSVSLSDGDYAGGICGLSYATIRNCCAKCSLGGKRYIGGIVGNGYDAAKEEDRSSLVAGCYSLVEILDSPQFAGAISGGSEGVYENNFFVPAGFAGMDKLSIHGQAEPMDFADFAAVEGLPEECRSFTLRFVVDGEVMKELPFSYGDSFDRSVFPKVERRDGSYAVWDKTDLRDLRFDTVVTANFRMDETVLRSALVRADGRAAVYVDGQFQSGDQLTVETQPIPDDAIDSFRGNWRQTVKEQLRSIFREGEPDYAICVSVEEMLHVAFPDDGLDRHTIRLLAPDGSTKNHRIYLNTDEGWQRLYPDVFGSYYLFSAEGSEANMALVSTIQSWWVLVYIAGAVAVFALLVLALAKLSKWLRGRKKKARSSSTLIEKLRQWRRTHKKLLAGLVCGLILILLILFLILRFSSITAAVSTWRLLRDFSGEETAIQTEIRVHSDELDITLSTPVLRISENGKMISCTEQYGIPLYFCGGKVYLENGRAFEVSGSSMDQNAVLNLAREVFRKGEIEVKREGGEKRYEARLDAQNADAVLRLMLAGESAELLSAESMTATVTEREGDLAELSFSGNGITESGKAFTLMASLVPGPIEERPVLPAAVKDAITNANAASGELLTEDFLLLIAAWMKYDSAETVRADLAVSADCGALRLDNSFSYFRQKVNQSFIHGLKGKLFTVYFTDEAACTAGGAVLSTAEEHAKAVAKLIPLAKELCLNGTYSADGTAKNRQYRITLDADKTSSLIETLLPELSDSPAEFGACTLTITTDTGELSQISLNCQGTIRIVSRDVEATIELNISFLPTGEAVGIPAAVCNALLP